MADSLCARPWRLKFNRARYAAPAYHIYASATIHSPEICVAGPKPTLRLNRLPKQVRHAELSAPGAQLWKGLERRIHVQKRVFVLIHQAD
jgi:hypothetical protein